MQKSPLRNILPYLLGLLACILAFTIGGGLYIYDLRLTDNELLERAQAALQEDLKACAAQYDPSLGENVDRPSGCIACELTYDGQGKLIEWNNSEYLPSLDRFAQLKDIQLNEDFLSIKGQGREYLQIVVPGTNRTRVVLIPVYIRYEVSNNFLIPYVFLGRYFDLFSDEDRKQIKPFEILQGNFIRLYSIEKNTFLIALNDLRLSVMRIPIRRAALIFSFLGLLGLLVLIRVYTLNHWETPWKSDLLLVACFLGFRGLLVLLDLPGQYLPLELFSPDLVAVEDILAPSLGDMTLNIFLLAFIIWVIYKNSFGTLGVIYRKVRQIQWVNWGAAVVNLCLSAGLIWLYLHLFRIIIDNSQVEIEFSNVFKTNFYSYLILLDMGVLLMAFVFCIILLLRYNVYLGFKLDFPWSYLIGSLVTLVIICLTLFGNDYGAILITSVSLLLLSLVIFRIPHGKVLKYDLPNYLVLLGISTLLAAFGMMRGMEAKDMHYVTKLADKILEDRKNRAVGGYRHTEIDLVTASQQEEIRDKYEELDNMQDFVDWFTIEFLDPNFEFFETRLFAFDQNWQRVDKFQEAAPPVELRPSEKDFSIDAVGVTVLDGKLFEIPSRDDRFTEAFIAHFKLSLDSINNLNLFLELSSNPYGVGSIAPMLLIRSNTYQEEEFFSGYDYAIYKDRKLLVSSGETAFPINLASDIPGKDPYFAEGRDYVEYVKSIPYAQVDSWRSLVVRYPKKTSFNGFTTFSFIFYFYTFILILLVISPSLLFQVSRQRIFFTTLPIRTKIRVALVAVSIMPIIGIILFLYPFINDRYQQQADSEIITETKRIAKILEEDIEGQYDPISRQHYQDQIRKRLESLSKTLPNDVHVFDADGHLIGSTKPQIYDLGISSGLMADKAYRLGQQGAFSNLVMEEQLGNLRFFAGYQSVVGSGNKPVGYVNVAFLNKKEQLTEQVFGLLAYLANIYLLAFMVVGLVAVVVSNAITQPLSLIQQRLATTRLGNVNKPIDYKSNDEIGAIVAAYNSMVDKLSESEQMLKATQRQLAWRQMARQVAHEIKNPLTPMRLRIQQLVRAWNAQAPNLEKMFPKVMKTLLSQIDSMVNIANSFSQFARMPDAVKSEVSLNEIMNEVVDLYDQAEGITWDIEITEEEFAIHADRDQVSRALGNIVKNGIQAMDEGGHLAVSMETNGSHAMVVIADNGKGMTEEIKSRVFEPNFSTKTSGMGLGLAIVKRIIETTGGEIWFETEEEVGTSFYIKFLRSNGHTPQQNDGMPAEISES